MQRIRQKHGKPTFFYNGDNRAERGLYVRYVHCHTAVAHTAEIIVNTYLYSECLHVLDPVEGTGGGGWKIRAPSHEHGLPKRHW